MIKKYPPLFLVFLTIISGCWAQPTLKYNKIFERCEGLQVYQDEYHKLQRHTDNTRGDLEKMVEHLNHHMAMHPENRMECLMLLGDLYRKVRPEELRDPWKSINCFEEGYHLMDPTDSLSRSEACVRLATMYSMMVGYPSLFTSLHYMGEAAKMNPKLSILMGDYFLFGWGVKQDLFLADVCYHTSILSGNDATSNIFYLLYILDQDLQGSLDTVAKGYMEHAVYLMQIEKRWDSAGVWIYKAAARDFTPAYYELGVAMLQDIIPCRDRVCKDEAWEWIQKAAAKGYAPAIYELAKQKKDVELLQRAAEAGMPKAMKDLGEYYLDKTYKSKVTHHDANRALYWLMMASQFIVNGVVEEIDSVISAEHYTAQQIEELEQRVQLHYNLLRENRNKLIDHIQRSQRYRKPCYRETYFNKKKSLQGARRNEEVKLAMIECYETLYELMGKEARKHTSMSRQYERYHLKQLQKEMKFLRERGNGLMSDAIGVDPLETTNP